MRASKLAAAAALAAGLTAAWLMPSRLTVLAALAMIIAAANGYSKAYSP
jgi:hypothetical protein